MKRYKRQQRDFRKQKKYNSFKNEIKLFTEKQIDSIRNRISKIQTILEMELGQHNAKRLLDYPCINNGIKHKGICVACGLEKDLIHFDDDASICKNCAIFKNLI